MKNSEINNETALLRQVANGDEAAFRQLLHHYHALCYNISFKVLRDSWMAEDMVQEVFLKIWLHREQLTTIDNLGAWLRTVTANKLYDYLKKKKAETRRIQNWWLEAREAPHSLTSSFAQEEEFSALIEQAVGTLSPRQQQVFRLIKLEGYSRIQTARAINVSPETVKTHLDQAMRSVRAFCMSKLDSSFFILLIAIFLKEKF